MGADNEALLQALKDAGHDSVAQHLTDQSLAQRLEEAGHTDLAAGLKSKLSVAGTAGSPARPTSGVAKPDPGEEFLADLKKAAEDGWKSLPGLLEG